MAHVSTVILEKVRSAVSSTEVFTLVGDAILGGEHDGVYFFGGLYDEPNVQTLLARSEDPKEEAMFGLLQLIVYGVMKDLETVVGSTQPILKGPIEKELKGLVTPAYRHRLQVLSILTLAGNPQNPLTRVSHQQLASVCRIPEGAAAHREVEGLIMDLIASELALCRIDQQHQVVDIRNATSRHIFPGSQKEASTQLIYLPFSAGSVPTLDSLLSRLGQFETTIRDATTDGDAAFTEEMTRSANTLHKRKVFDQERSRNVEFIAKRFAEEKRKLEAGRDGMGRMMDMGADQLKHFLGRR